MLIAPFWFSADEFCVSFDNSHLVHHCISFAGLGESESLHQLGGLSGGSIQHHEQAELPAGQGAAPGAVRLTEGQGCPRAPHRVARQQERDGEIQVQLPLFQLCS